MLKPTVDKKYIDFSYMGVGTNLLGYSNSRVNKEVTTDLEGNFSFPIDLFKTGGGAEESKRLGVPLLGRIPISMEVMSATDRGKPIILSNPQSTVSEIFRDIAKKIISHIGN